MSPSAAKRALEPANGHPHSQPPEKRTKSKAKVEPQVEIPQSLRASLYSPSALLKIWTVAQKALGTATPPVLYPEYTGKDNRYVYRALDFWTSGFFPGSLYLLLERQTKYPTFYIPKETDAHPHRLHLQHLCEWWSANLHQNAGRKDTHDLGFMIAPWAIKAWELHRSPQAYSSLILAGYSLASRFDARVQSLRSWDVCYTKRYSFTNPEDDFLVIIDNMINLDLLFWVSRETGDRALYEIGVAHAKTTRVNHIRGDGGTVHVVNYDVATGSVKGKFTHQGYSDASCWSRGQAWGILGFMQTFGWTGDRLFLETARELADYFLKRLPRDYVPYWDFDAPVDEACPRDTSAGMVACCGLVLLYHALKDTEEDAARVYLDGAMSILEGTVSKFMTPSSGRFDVEAGMACSTFPPDEKQTQPGRLVGSGDVPDTILDAATVCNYEFASRRWADHGLVYGDYYFLLLGNMLLEMGMVR
ncbi:Six-hairpin glycosidase-like protein [Aspergillus californicus]